MGFARDKAAELSKQLVTLAIDVASFNDKADADVIRDFQSALVGNTETVRKYGIVITEARLKQEALDSGLIKVARTLTEQEKIQIRLNLIMQGTTDAQGDAIRTADSFNNRMKALDASVETLSIALGELLLPVATKVVGVLIDITNAFTLLKQSTDDYGFSAKVLSEQMSLVRSEIEANERAMEAIINRTFDLQFATAEEIAEYKRLESALVDARLQLAEMEVQQKSGKESTDEAAEAIARLSAAHREAAGPIADFVIGLTEAEKRAASLQLQYSLLGEEEKKVSQLSLETAIAIGASADSFKDAAKSVLAAALAQSIATQLKSIFATIPFPFNLVVAAGAGAATKALFDAIPAFQRGGVSGGGLAMVGEGGPELVNLPRGARVFNNTDSRQIINNQGPKTIIVQIAGRTVASVLAPDLERAAQLGQNNLVVNA